MKYIFMGWAGGSIIGCLLSFFLTVSLDLSAIEALFTGIMLGFAFSFAGILLGSTIKEKKENNW